MKDDSERSGKLVFQSTSQKKQSFGGRVMADKLGSSTAILNLSLRVRADYVFFEVGLHRFPV